MKDRAAENKRYSKTVKGRAMKLLHNAKSRAKKKKLKFNLSRKWIADRIVKPCPITGIEINLVDEGRGRHPHPHAPSIHRLDPKKGYTTDNCVITVWVVNMMIGPYRIDQIAPVARALVHYAEEAEDPR